MRVRWEYPAKKVLLEYLGWPERSNVAQAVRRFADRHGERLDSGEYQLDVPGFRVTARIDRKTGVMLVFYLHRAKR